MRSTYLAMASLALLMGLAVVADALPTTGLEQYRERQGPDLIPGLDRFTKRNSEMLRQGLIKISPMRHSPARLASNSAAAVALYGKPCPPPDEEKLKAGILPSTALLPAADKTLPPGVMEVSLVCDSEDLFGTERGIITHPMMRGHDSERLTWLSARLGNDLFVESPLGLRVHGGLSRQIQVKSFAMVFRKDYCGTNLSPPGLFFGPETPPARQFLLVGASHIDRYLGALATDIADLVGCKTSKHAPAIVYLNGTRIDAPYFVYEQQSEEFVKSHFGLQNFDWVRLKDKATEETVAYKALDKWTRKMSARMTFQDAATRFNLQDLCAWVVTMSYTITVDNNQGGFYRDQDNPKAAWQSLVWDLDGAFKRGFEGDVERTKMFAEDPFQWVLLGLRARLFKRLMKESAEFRDYFREFAHEKVTQKLTREKLMELSDRYLVIAKLQPKLEPALTPVLQQAREFLATRNEAFLAYVDRYASEVGREAE
ncbi:MAG: hypothetical protein JWO08_4266 [Verrucomicrobiaceae bacterium]|nr:hypothetical protein [Verrucomicrobiaceae bacterium]